MAARTSLIVLIAAAYIGAAVALQMCWQHSFILAVAAAPLGGSLAVLSAALLLYLRNPEDRGRQVGSAKRVQPEVMGRAS